VTDFHLQASSEITVVITTFNDGDLLGTALQSVVDQTISPSQVLLIDDGSEPRTAPSILASFPAAVTDSVSYSWARNGGPSFARNRGLKLATSRYIAFLDADDRWLPHHLALKLMRMASLEESYSTVYNGFVEFDGATGSHLPTIKIGAFDGPIRDAPLGLPGGPPAGMPFQMHRTSALREVGGFDEGLRVNEDFDLLLRLGNAGYRMSGSTEVTVERRVHAKSLSRIDPARTLREMETFLIKAEKLGLLSNEAIASKRKWGRISLAKAMMRGHEHSSTEILAQFREAFRASPPSDLKQLVLRGLSAVPPIGVPAIWAARRLARSGGQE